jgi:hypothetical protein
LLADLNTRNEFWSERNEPTAENHDAAQGCGALGRLKWRAAALGQVQVVRGGAR